MALYSPAIHGNWTLAMESKQVQDLPVTHLMDALIVKIQNSNGLDFCSIQQMMELQRLLQLEIG